MKVCMIQFTERPTPDYDEIAGYLRSWGHEVWVTRLNEEGNFLWDSGDGRRLLIKGPRPFPPYLPDSKAAHTLWTHLAHSAFVRRLRGVIRMLQPDIVQINSSTLKYTSIIPLAMPARTAFILDVRQIGDRRLPVTQGIRIRNGIRSLSRRISGIFCFDHSCYLHAAGARKGLGSQWERWGTVIPMGLHDRFLNVPRKAVSGRDGPDVVHFIYVGSMVRHRRLDIIMSAIRSVADETDKFKFHFQGRDASDGYYPDLIKQLELEQYVELLPPIPYEEVPQRLIEYDAAIAYVPYEPTDWSYHPTLKVIEYRAVGIPIIATDLAPNREIVISGQNGLLCDNTAEDFAEAMLRFIHNRSLLEQTTENAERLRTGVPWLEVSRMYEALYERLLSSPK